MNIMFNKLLKEIVVTHTSILNDKLVGIYVHGSIAFGCATEYSDIDYLVVVNVKLTKQEKLAIMDSLVTLSEKAPKKGLEMSIVTIDSLNPFVYPTPFELHASSGYIEAFQVDQKLCEDQVDYDLAAHITVIQERGMCLYGSPIDAVFSVVPVEYFVDSILRDIEDAENQLENEPVYILLNLTRVWMFLQEGALVSKEEGGMWACEKLQSPFSHVIGEAIDSYQNGNVFKVTKEAIDAVHILLSKIEELNLK
ncbi:DUF4111 domain-containing protein [Bacillus sp. BGMRC 2118]|nr:DUF4111 domain-containing protein [Bacillus sp. BGMRC 2118]